ncbi:hypothetical protein p1B255 (plasmid) [Aromatoleum aromaticum EbN1]|uniref:Uncharacterized protein n=1 Tax=Aromatoleum aromaticum (strain DSM 19018 / LMG 30748 / EbN1) TaxID=76114 RepID=Q5NWX3_AROAE|nr:hypothetical protein p1B255 [Aromatoleum aromaticum EbN1]
MLLTNFREHFHRLLRFIDCPIRITSHSAHPIFFPAPTAPQDNLSEKVSIHHGAVVPGIGFPLADAFIEHLHPRTPHCSAISGSILVLSSRLK